MVQRTLLNLLRLLLLLGPKPERRRALFFSLGFLLGPKPERRRALLFSLGFFIFLFYFFFYYPGIFGGPPGKPSENLMCSSHILARINMKLGTHRSYRAEQLLHRMSWAPPNRKSAIQGCLKSTCSGI